MNVMIKQEISTILLSWIYFHIFTRYQTAVSAFENIDTN